MDSYNKYFDCILMYFYINDNSVLLKSLEKKLDNPADFYYNYVQYDDEIWLKNIFDHLVDKFTETNQNEFYKCIWNVIHTVPLIMNEQNSMVEYFYKEYVIKKIGCVNCIMHYIYNISEASNDLFQNKSLLFQYFVDLHNEINVDKYKEVMLLENVKTSLTNILNDQYNLDVNII